MTRKVFNSSVRYVEVDGMWKTSVQTPSNIYPRRERSEYWCVNHGSNYPCSSPALLSECGQANSKSLHYRRLEHQGGQNALLSPNLPFLHASFASNTLICAKKRPVGHYCAPNQYSKGVYWERLVDLLRSLLVQQAQLDE